MKKLIGITAAIAFLSGIANASILMAEINASYFNPSEKAFKDIYGNGITYGGEISLTLRKWIDVWAGGDYFTKKGKMTFTEEETKIRIIPLYAGLKLRLPTKGISPYIGLGIGYFQYKETSLIGEVKEADLGYIGQVGCSIGIEEALFFDIKGSYSYCKAKPSNVEADLGGFKAGIGIGFRY